MKKLLRPQNKTSSWHAVDVHRKYHWLSGKNEGKSFFENNSVIDHIDQSSA